MVSSPEYQEEQKRFQQSKSPKKLPEQVCQEIKLRHQSAPQTYSSDEEPLVIDFEDDHNLTSFPKRSTSHLKLDKAPSQKAWKKRVVPRLSLANDASSGNGSSIDMRVVSPCTTEDREEQLFPCTLPQSVSDDECNGSKDAPSLLPTTIDSEEFRPKPSGDADHESFWRYKVAPKGPQPVITFTVDATHPEKNPHKPILFTDPVYDKSQPLTIQHGGRARTGEGNDITPNPRKLAKLGADIELVKEKMAALGDNPKHRREKMRCSSRLCRLKRSANHEANKIKLSGLEKEREELSSVITKMKHRINGQPALNGSCLSYLEYLKTETLTNSIAGDTSNYVNSVIQSRSNLYYTDSESDD